MRGLRRPSPARSSPARQAFRYGGAPLAALAFVLFLQQGEQTSLSLAVDGIKGTFHVSDATVGFLPLALAAVGLLGSVPFGVLADRRRRTFLLAASTAVWTLTMVLCGVATSFLFLFLARLGVGFVEANGPAAISLLGDYYPVEQRARRMGLYQLGSFVGALFAYLVGSLLVQHGGWREAFLMWVPFGLAATVYLLRQPEPRRGDQEIDFAATAECGEAPGPTGSTGPTGPTGPTGSAGPAGSAGSGEAGGGPTRGSAACRGALDPLAASGPIAGLEAVIELGVEEDLRYLSSAVQLPPPRRVGCLDYRSAGPREVLREIWRIRSMRYGVLSLTVAQLMINGLAFWGVYYFQTVHHLSVALAGLVAALLGIGASAGILAGGQISDRLLRRGMVNARIYVASAGCLLGAALLIPAFDSTHLAVTAPLFLLGGFMLTLPVAPSEALVADVVVCELRGRANTIRTVVRTLSQGGPFLIGMISSVVGIRLALVAFTPVYAIGGVLMLFAVRHYAWDLAYVLAETRRTLPLRTAAGEGVPR